MEPTKILEILKNFKKGPQTTLFGLLCFVFGGFLIAFKSVKGVDLELISVETAIFALGGYFCLTSDDIFKKKS